MKKYLYMASVFVLAGNLHGCTWVKTTPAGESVRVATSDMVSDCRRMSKVTVSLKSRVAGVERKPGKVASELATLARNEGGRLGGDTVVAESLITEGSQVFAIYDCN
jgi:hypothetical protein